MGTCMECGKQSVKQEDFLVQEYDIVQEGGTYRKKQIDYPGIIRVSLCAGCIARKYEDGRKIKGEITVLRIVLLGVIFFIGAGIAAAVFPDSPIVAGFFGVAGIGAMISRISTRAARKKQIKEREGKFRQAAATQFQEVSLLDIIDEHKLVSERARTIVNIQRLNGEWASFSEYNAMSTEDILKKSSLVCAPLPGMAGGRFRDYFAIPHEDETDELLYVADFLHKGMGERIQNAAGVATVYQKIKRAV